MSFLKLFRDFADGTQIKDRTALESKGFFDEDFKEENFEIIFVRDECNRQTMFRFKHNIGPRR